MLPYQEHGKWSWICLSPACRIEQAAKQPRQRSSRVAAADSEYNGADGPRGDADEQNALAANPAA